MVRRTVCKLLALLLLFSVLLLPVSDQKVLALEESYYQKIKTEEEKITEDALVASHEKVQMSVGEELEVNILISNDNKNQDITKNVSWEVSDKDILSIKEGKLIAKSAGSTKVIAKYMNQETTIEVNISPKSRAISVDVVESQGKVKLDWEDVGAESYNVLRGKDLIASKIEETSLIDDNVKKGEEYSYKVEAVFNNGKKISSKSVKIKISSKSKNENQKYIICLNEEVDVREFMGDYDISEEAAIFVKSTNFIIVPLKNSDLSMLEKDPRVSHLEVDGVLRLNSDHKIYSKHRLLNQLKNNTQMIPWGLDSIFDGKIEEFGEYGENIKVAVLDTGVNKHLDINIKSSISVEENEDDKDDNGHGTLIAGIIAGINNNEGIVGIAPKIDLHSIKVLNEKGIGSISSIIRGIDWAIENKVDIVVLSATTDQKSDSLQEIIKKADESGIILIFAAGETNHGYPASYSQAISVGSLDKDYKPIYNDKDIDLFAPGNEIVSTFKEDKYGVISDTSAAAAYIAGAAAIIWSKDKNLSNREVKNILIDTADNKEQHREINIFKALEKVDIGSSVTSENTINTIMGTPGNDSLTGDSSDDHIMGLEGDDFLDGDYGNDILDGGTGNDKLLGYWDNDKLLGGDGDDNLNGGDDADELYGGDGIDILDGDDGNDLLDGGLGNDQLSGYFGDDLYIFASGYGQDKITGSESGVDTVKIIGEPSDIKLYRESSDLLIRLNSTDDSLRVSYYFTSINSVDQEIDRIEFSNGEVWDLDDILLQPIFFIGTEGDDRFIGDKEINVMYGFGGADSLYGYEGNDIIYGGAGADLYLVGGKGNDSIYGEDDNDKLDGDYGNDLLDGGLGNDKLMGYWDDDKLVGGDGDDNLNGGDGKDELYGGNGIDILDGDNGNDLLDGGFGNDQLKGYYGDDVYIFSSGYGEDIISETSGIDTLRINALPSDVTLSKVNSDMVITFKNNTTDKITVKYQYSSSTAIERIEYSDGSEWSPNDSDGDRISNQMEVQGIRIGFKDEYSRTVYTDPNNSDTDGDGINDGVELLELQFKNASGDFYEAIDDPSSSVNGSLIEGLLFEEPAHYDYESNDMQTIKTILLDIEDYKNKLKKYHEDVIVYTESDLLSSQGKDQVLDYVFKIDRAALSFLDVTEVLITKISSQGNILDWQWLIDNDFEYIYMIDTTNTFSTMSSGGAYWLAVFGTEVHQRVFEKFRNDPRIMPFGITSKKIPNTNPAQIPDMVYDTSLGSNMDYAEIFELKPITWAKFRDESKYQLATDQLTRYVNAYQIAYPDLTVSKGTIETWDVVYHVVNIPKYKNAVVLYQFPDQPGMVYYAQFRTDRDYIDKFVVPMKGRKYSTTINGNVVEVETLAKDTKTGKVVAVAMIGGAAVIVIGTLVEDVFTVGGGIADDPASFAAAYLLMQNGITILNQD